MTTPNNNNNSTNNNNSSVSGSATRNQPEGRLDPYAQIVLLLRDGADKTPVLTDAQDLIKILESPSIKAGVKGIVQDTHEPPFKIVYFVLQTLFPVRSRTTLETFMDKHTTIKDLFTKYDHDKKPSLFTFGVAVCAELGFPFLHFKLLLRYIKTKSAGNAVKDKEEAYCRVGLGGGNKARTEAIANFIEKQNDVIEKWKSEMGTGDATFDEPVVFPATDSTHPQEHQLQGNTETSTQPPQQQQEQGYAGTSTQEQQGLNSVNQDAAAPTVSKNNKETDHGHCGTGPLTQDAQAGGQDDDEEVGDNVQGHSNWMARDGGGANVTNNGFQGGMMMAQSTHNNNNHFRASVPGGTYNNHNNNNNKTGAVRPPTGNGNVGGRFAPSNNIKNKLPPGYVHECQQQPAPLVTRDTPPGDSVVEYNLQQVYSHCHNYLFKQLQDTIDPDGKRVKVLVGLPVGSDMVVEVTTVKELVDHLTNYLYDNYLAVNDVKLVTDEVYKMFLNEVWHRWGSTILTPEDYNSICVKIQQDRPSERASGSSSFPAACTEAIAASLSHNQKEVDLVHRAIDEQPMIAKEKLEEKATAQVVGMLGGINDQAIPDSTNNNINNPQVSNVAKIRGGLIAEYKKIIKNLYVGRADCGIRIVPGGNLEKMYEVIVNGFKSDDNSPKLRVGRLESALIRAFAWPPRIAEHLAHMINFYFCLFEARLVIHDNMTTIQEFEKEFEEKFVKDDWEDSLDRFLLTPILGDLFFLMLAASHLAEHFKGTGVDTLVTVNTKVENMVAILSSFAHILDNHLNAVSNDGHTANYYTNLAKNGPVKDCTDLSKHLDNRLHALSHWKPDDELARAEIGVVLKKASTEAGWGSLADHYNKLYVKRFSSKNDHSNSNTNHGGNPTNHNNSNNSNGNASSKKKRNDRKKKNQNDHQPQNSATGGGGFGGRQVKKEESGARTFTKHHSAVTRDRDDPTDSTPHGSCRFHPATTDEARADPGGRHSTERCHTRGGLLHFKYVPGKRWVPDLDATNKDRLANNKNFISSETAWDNTIKYLKKQHRS